MRRSLVACGLGGAVALFVYACGGTGDTGLDSGTPDTGTGQDVTVDNTVPPDDGSTTTDGATGDGSDGAVVDAGPNCTQATCIVGLAVGGFHACGLVKDGSVRCWGRNNYGQLGVGLPSDGGAFDPTPKPIPQTPPLTGVSQITASHFSVTLSSTCAMVGTQAKCFGNNSYGQLGQVSADGGAAWDNNPHPTALQVQGVPNLASVWTGNLHSCAVAATGEMYCWGDDQNAELGRPAGNQQILPAGLVVTDAGAATAVGPGYDFGVGLLQTGGVITWGGNNVDQLGRTAPDPSPAGPIGSLTGVTSIAAGFEHACAVASGALYCWGTNGNGQAGGTADPVTTPTVVNVASKTLVQVTAGYSHTCALASDHTVYCWGQNDFGQCATGGSDAGFNNADVTTPTQVQGLSGNVLEVQAGTNHTCARIDGGSVMCWGANDRGQLGQGLVDGGIPMDNNPHPTPVTVVFP